MSEPNEARVLIPVADGTEEMEAVIAIDILRRAGCEVCVVGLDGGEVTCSRGVRLRPDAVWTSISMEAFGALVLPGGARGTERFLNHAGVLDAIRTFHQSGRWVAAICAAPLALQAAGILRGRRATCHPAVADQLREAHRQDAPVVIDGNIVTGQGAGAAVEFALALAARLCGSRAADQVARDIVHRR